MEWKMNSSALRKGMLIRRPGLVEALEVVNVRDNQAKIKLPGGKTSTIPASAEVEWAMPEMDASKALAGNTREKFLEKNPEIAEDPQTELDLDSEVEPGTGWQTDWNLLDVGSKIGVLGEVGEFRVIRLTDSSARIKSDRTSQIQPLSIGHKFKIVGDSAVSESKPAAGTKTDKAKGKAAKPKPATKARKVVEPDPEIDNDPEPMLFDNGPSDKELLAIENGDDHEPAEDDDLDLSDLDSEPRTDNDETYSEDNDNDDEENDSMPSRESTPAPVSQSKRTSAAYDTDRGSLLTLGQIAERVGISYPTLMRYVRDHGDRMPHEGSGRARRYYPDTIDIVREIRSEMKGGRPPGSNNKAKGTVKSFGKLANKPKSVAEAPEPNQSTRQDRPARRERSASVAATSIPAIQIGASNDTIDQMLSSTIDHARAQILGLEALITSLEAQRESRKLWS